jgi:hypothetical protein
VRLSSFAAALCALPCLVAQADELSIFKAWLGREHPGYHSDEGPAPFRNKTVEDAYPGVHFYYVLTYPRGIPPPYRDMLTLVAQVDERGTVLPLRAVDTFRRGLRSAKSKEDARKVAAAVLILAFSDPGQRRWPFVPEKFVVKGKSGGWVCTYSTGVGYESVVTFDKHGTLVSFSANAPPVG